MLTACGFRLAGTAAVPKSISSIYLVTHNFSDSQRAILLKQLELAGARIIDSAGDGSNRLTVRLRTIPDRTLVESASSGKTVERIARRIDYSLSDAHGETLIESTSLSQQRDITLDDDNLHSSNRERREVIDDLELALFGQLIRRLQRL